MAKLLKLRRGTNTQHSSFTGAEGEVTVNITNDSLHVHDGTTAGGRELMRADKDNMPTSGVTAGTYGSSSAIPAITVDAKGLVTSATTNAIDTTSITNGTSNVSVASGGNITATRAGTTRLTVTGSGIDVNGSIEADGGNVAGTLNTNRLIVDDDGSTSPNVVIKTDDGNPYAFCVKNDTYSTIENVGLTGFQENDGDIFLEAKGNAEYVQFNLRQNNGTTTRQLIYGAEDGALALYHAGSAKLQTTSGGIDVTGTVSCDGLTCDGSATIQASTGVLVLRDSDSTTSSNINYVEGLNNAGSAYWQVGHTSSGNEHLYVNNIRNGAILFQTNATTRCYIDNNGHFTPNANNTYDLGSSSYRWRNLYTNDLNLSNEGSTNDVDGTWGSWTIQEGEDDLFLLNRRNGKKYKFNLSEVN